MPLTFIDSRCQHSISRQSRGGPGSCATASPLCAAFAPPPPPTRFVTSQSGCQSTATSSPSHTRCRATRLPAGESVSNTERGRVPPDFVDVGRTRREKMFPLYQGAVCAYPNKRMSRRPARAKHAAVGPWRPINHDMTRTLTNPTPGIARTSLERLGVPPCCVGLPARLAKNRMAQTATGHGGPKLFVRSAPKLGGPGSLRSQQEQVLW